jgi:hypothetical protein
MKALIALAASQQKLAAGNLSGSSRHARRAEELLAGLAREGDSFMGLHLLLLKQKVGGLIAPQAPRDLDTPAFFIEVED